MFGCTKLYTDLLFYGNSTKNNLLKIKVHKFNKIKLCRFILKIFSIKYAIQYTACLQHLYPNRYIILYNNSAQTMQIDYRKFYFDTLDRTASKRVRFIEFISEV